MKSKDDDLEEDRLIIERPSAVVTRGNEASEEPVMAGLSELGSEEG